MKILTAFITLSLYTFTSNAGIKLPQKIKCSTQVKKFLKKQKATNNFSKIFKPSTNVLRSPTKKIGTWVQVSNSRNRYENLWVFEPNFRKKYDVTDKCEVVLKQKSTYSYKESPFSDFTDVDLKRILKKKKAGLIYLMNPSFIYSIKHLKKARAFAKSKKLKLTVLLTSRSNFSKEKRKIANFSEVKTNRSVELKMRQAELHSPTYVFHKNGKIIDEKLVGVQNAKSLEKHHSKLF